MNWNAENLSRKFVEEHRLPFPVGYDSGGQIAKLYGVEATPTSLFIAKDGKVVERQEAALEEADFDQRIEKLLAS